MRCRFALAVALALVAAGRSEAQTRLNLPTTPERTKYEETSKYEDVMTFLRAVDQASQLIRLDSMGKTFENRTMPLAVVGTMNATTPQAVQGTGKLRIYLQGNIHAGEVEGKEVLQMLLREIAEGQHREWLDSLVLLVNPIYNADGNERFNIRNRGRQHGPVRGMGQRPNAQGFDLNRDHMRLESPEAKAVVSMMARYDPQVGVDLHTTNGSQHGYFLTYAPPLHPSTASPIIELLRERMFPHITRNVQQKHGMDFYYYGNFAGRDTTQRAWATFEHVPRFNNNYVGLRNRIGILSEAYSYATFEDRIKATYHFVTEILDYAYRNASELRRIVEQVDRTSVVGQQLSARSELDRTGKPATILVGEVIREANPYSGDTIYRRADVKRPVQMMEYGTFRPTEQVTAPRAYFIPPVWVGRIGATLQYHGVRARPLTRDTSLTVERFRIDSTTVATQPFQGHRQRTLWGQYEVATADFPAGTLVVDLNQPLGRLAFFLLEARSDDGFVNWNFFDPEIQTERYYPVVRALR
ncbi:MAG: M14 family metallopeptidase [Longimicrobiales bacterium]